MSRVTFTAGPRRHPKVTAAPPPPPAPAEPSRAPPDPPPPARGRRPRICCVSPVPSPGAACAASRRRLPPHGPAPSPHLHEQQHRAAAAGGPALPGARSGDRDTRAPPPAAPPGLARPARSPPAAASSGRTERVRGTAGTDHSRAEGGVRPPRRVPPEGAVAAALRGGSGVPRGGSGRAVSRLVENSRIWGFGGGFGWFVVFISN